MSCALSHDTKAMIEFQLKNKEFLFYSSIIYEKIQKMGLNIVEREQEYVRMVNNMPNHLRIKDDPLYKPIMKYPMISFDETNDETNDEIIDETNDEIIDEDDYYEGCEPGTRKITFMKNIRNAADIA